MTLDEIREQKRNAIMSIARRHGVTGIRVFGSFARGEARPDSDLDLLCSSKPVPRARLSFPVELIADLEAEPSRKIEVTARAALHPLMREEVLREAVIL